MKDLLRNQSKQPNQKTMIENTTSFTPKSRCLEIVEQILRLVNVGRPRYKKILITTPNIILNTKPLFPVGWSHLQGLKVIKKMFCTFLLRLNSGQSLKMKNNLRLAYYRLGSLFRQQRRNLSDENKPLGIKYVFICINFLVVVKCNLQPQKMADNCHRGTYTAENIGLLSVGHVTRGPHTNLTSRTVSWLS